MFVMLTLTSITLLLHSEDYRELAFPGDFFMQWSDTIAVIWGLERKLQGSDLGELCLQNPTLHLDPSATERRGIPAVATYCFYGSAIPPFLQEKNDFYIASTCYLKMENIA